MSVTTSVWWPEDRVKATLSPEYVFNNLPSHLLSRLVAPLPWGEGLTSETYLDWILAKAGRFFLILVDIGVPERIFALVDESFDDSDLPIAVHSVHRLNLAPDSPDSALEQKFFLAQWRFVVRGIREGDHVKYTENEGVPVELQRTGAALVREGVEKVVLAGAVCRVYLRTQVTIGGAPHFFEEDEVLEEIRSLRRLAHDHVYSIFASYFVDTTVCILFSGVYERTLLSFLTDLPQAFKRLPKPQRRGILINWPHCLVNGLAWLHAHGQVHGAIRPSNILIDSDYKIFLGQFEALDTLLPPVKVDDVEAYQYGSPERWVRSNIVHGGGPQRAALPSGGRTSRKPSTRPNRLNLSMLRGSKHIDSDPVGSRPESVVSQGTAIRVGLPNSPSRFSYALSSSSGSSDGSARKRGFPSMKHPIIYSPSITSSNSSGSSGGTGPGSPNPVGLPTSSSAAVVQVWQSHQSDPEASDVFSLGAVVLDIFTHMCKRKISAFAHHRGAKNRTAGRGGGVADCSFHLDRNLVQVTSWITLLDSDAKKHKDPVFVAVRPMLSVVREMLSKDPTGRPSAFQIERQFATVIEQLNGTAGLHCTSNIQVRDLKSQSPFREAKQSPQKQQQLGVSSPRGTLPTTATSSPLTSEFSPEAHATSGPPSFSPEASVTSFNFPDWTRSYSQSSDTDYESSSGYETSLDHNPWRDPDPVLGPVSINDPTWEYRITSGDR
ncbi:conserved hypothetical protein [Aspergillus terreus NIH2624]|uniref:non-specific serine/threonine protein kinase n=1 Tax=Aspergillus terreus (strain NIH 2624 / FGSC A1156) TaxID=341663 RepID=Q0CQE6_ASPTN|nr:uncharacterized protein ATEG_04088 [Aspergillus terreus NIH2624]EAU35890.1 conserved hypothetical protein [Aspergillus terreus NIH2624]